MTAYGLKPTFVDREGYKNWKKQWSRTYNALCWQIKSKKKEVKNLQKSWEDYKLVSKKDVHNWPERIHDPSYDPVMMQKLRTDYMKLTGYHPAGSGRSAQHKLDQHRGVGKKMMLLLKEAHLRRDRIIAMKKEIEEQPFPLELENCRNVDFHYNKGAGEFPFLPMWTIRVKGKSYYVHEVNATVPWTTRERENGSTKGVLRFPKCSVYIDENGVAKIS